MGEYKLLLFPGGLLLAGWQGTRIPEHVNVCHVFTLGSSKPPRKINIGWPNPEYIICELAGFLLRGKLHWHLVRHYSETNMIQVFDTMDELFQQMRSPVPGHGVLFEMDGMLSVYEIIDGYTIINIWVLEDYERELWAFKCRVKFPDQEIKGFGTRSGRLAVVSWDDKVHLLFQTGEWLLQVDGDGELVASFRRGHLDIAPLWLKQSLVPHTFFPTLEGYVVNGPPFI
jgi:hypothetical protein